MDLRDVDVARPDPSLAAARSAAKRPAVLVQRTVLTAGESRPAISTARSRTSGANACSARSEQTSAAAAPSPIGAHIARVNGQVTGDPPGPARRSSRTDIAPAD